MRVTAQMTLVLAAIFAIVCYGVAITGFTSMGEMTDAAKIADAKGFAWFWVLLGTLAAAMGAVSIWIIRTGQE